MGQSKGGGYTQKATITPQQQTLLNQLLGNAQPQLQAAAEGFNQFLPGGGGGQAIADAAQRRFQQQTIPSIQNAFGVGAKSSSALNQALAAGAANLNSDIAAQLAQMQLSAASGLGSLASNQAQLGTQTPQFAYMQRQQPFWQSALLAGLGAGGQLGGSFLSRPSLPSAPMPMPLAQAPQYNPPIGGVPNPYMTGYRNYGGIANL